MSRGPFVRDEVEWTRAQLDTGRPLADVVSSLLHDRFGLCAVVRSLVEGADLPIDSATALVVDGGGAADAAYFRDLWNAAEGRCGTSADEAVSAVGDPRTESGESNAIDLDLWDAVESEASSRCVP